MRIPKWRDFTSSHLRTRLARYQIWKAQQTGPSQFVPTSLACQTTTHSVDRSSADASSPVCKVQSFIGLSFRACDFSLSNFLVCMCLPDATYCTVLRQLIITYMTLFALLMNMFPKVNYYMLHHFSPFFSSSTSSTTLTSPQSVRSKRRTRLPDAVYWLWEPLGTVVLTWHHHMTVDVVVDVVVAAAAAAAPAQTLAPCCYCNSNPPDDTLHVLEEESVGTMLMIGCCCY